MSPIYNFICCYGVYFDVIGYNKFQVLLGLYFIFYI